MQFKILCALLGASLGCLPNSSLLAQSITSYERPVRRTAVASREVIGGSRIDVRSAYTERRWVGVRSKGSAQCPKVEGWSGEPLLAEALRNPYLPLSPEERADQALLHRLGLDRFCVYTTSLSGPPAFVPPPGLAKAQRDRMALSASADLAHSISPTLADHFRGQTGGDSPLPLQGGRPTVRLTFIDSHPDEDPVSSRPSQGSQHGYTLAQLARQLVCHGPCAATVASRRALRYVDLPADQKLPPIPAAPEDQGGNAGLVSDLAAAIVEAVLDWRRDGGTEHLILNLSLGWDGELFGDLDTRKASNLEPSVRAVHDALRFAARRGVLVIAAAGNRRGGPVPSTLPLLPAAWELHRPCGLPFGLGRKLVYAVAGMDWQGLPLPNSRHGGRPRRTAYGDHAVAMAEGGPTPIYTGTSVSAAVVSSIAAMVWHLRPELHPDQVMSLIGRSGEPLKARADFYPWKAFKPLSMIPPPRQRRVSLCTAVARACGPDAALCPRLTSAPACPRWDRRSPQLASFHLPYGTPSTHISPAIVVPLSAHPPCDPRTRLWTADGKISFPPCPTDQFGGVTDQRWVWPQPSEVPCPGCKLVPDQPYTNSQQSGSNLGAPDTQSFSTLAGDPYYSFDFDVSADWRPFIRSATLNINCEDDPDRIPGYPIDLDQGWSQTITGIGDGQTLSGCTAQINFEVTQTVGTVGLTPELQAELNDYLASYSFPNPVIVDP